MFQRSVRDGEARDLEDIFEALDTQRVGSISKKAFERVVEEDLRLNVRPRVLRALVQKFDRNNDGRIYIQDFIDFCTRQANYERPSSHSSHSNRRDQRDRRDRRDRRSGRDVRFPRSVERDLKEMFMDGRGDGLSTAFARHTRGRDDRLARRDFEDVVKKELGLSRAQVEQVVDVVDANNSGHVDYELFLEQCKELGWRDRARDATRDATRDSMRNSRDRDSLRNSTRDSRDRDGRGGGSTRGSRDDVRGSRQSYDSDRRRDDDVRNSRSSFRGSGRDGRDDGRDGRDDGREAHVDDIAERLTKR